MAFIPGTQTITVTGTWSKIDGTPAQGKITFRIRNSTADALNDVIYTRQNVEKKLDANGHLSITLIATDSEIMSERTGLIITEEIAGVARYTWETLLPSGLTEVDLADCAPIVERTFKQYVLQSTYEADKLNDTDAIPFVDKGEWNYEVGYEPGSIVKAGGIYVNLGPDTITGEDYPESGIYDNETDTYAPTKWVELSNRRSLPSYVGVWQEGQQYSYGNIVKYPTDGAPDSTFVFSLENPSEGEKSTPPGPLSYIWTPFVPTKSGGPEPLVLTEGGEYPRVTNGNTAHYPNQPGTIITNAGRRWIALGDKETSPTDYPGVAEYNNGLGEMVPSRWSPLSLPQQEIDPAVLDAKADKTYVDQQDAALGTRIDNIESPPAKNGYPETAISVSLTGVQAVFEGNFTTVDMSVENADVGNNYDPATSEYTVPADGFYLCTATIRRADNAGGTSPMGLGIGTYNGDGPSFYWNYFHGDSARSAIQYTRNDVFFAGQKVRLFTYGTAQLIAASMTIIRVA